MPLERRSALSRLLRVLSIGTAIVVAVAGLGVGALLFASPINPVVWSPPEGTPRPSCEAAPTLTVGTLVNDLPGTADGLGFDTAGRLYAALATGFVVRIDPASARWTKVGVTGAAPALLTGLATAPNGRVYAVDERGGALYDFAVGDSGTVDGRLLVSEVNGKRLRWTNDVTWGNDGLVYFTSTSQRRGLDRNFDEVLEHAGTGQLLAYDPATGTARELDGALQMANGIAPGAGRGELLVAETSAYRVRSFKRGEDGKLASSVAVDNLPGMPGNIRRGAEGIYWVTLLAPRNPTLDALAGSPLRRRLMAWLPASMRPRQPAMTCIIRLSGGASGYEAQAFRLSGKDPLPSFSTAIEHNGRLYLSPAGFGRPDEPRLFVADLPK